LGYNVYNNMKSTATTPLIRSIRSCRNLAGQRVLLRVDFNVPLTKKMTVAHSEDYRIARTINTIKYLLAHKNKVIIVSHLGRPDGKVQDGLRLDPVAKRLAQLLKRKVYKIDVSSGPLAEQAVDKLKPGQVLLLENIRFDRREEQASPALAKALAKLADVYVNDAFAVSHRDQSSVSTIQDYLPAYAGLLLEEEIARLSQAIRRPAKPLTVIIGGAKISTKLKLIKNFVPLADNILLGGALANTVLHAMGISVGQSLIEPEMVKELKKIKLTDNQLRVPLDGVMARSYHSVRGRRDALADIRANEVILDIGPDTIELYRRIISSAKMVIWNGPMGLIEQSYFARGTRQLIKILAKSRAETIVGGGETVQMIRKMGFERKFDFISTGGGAMLEFLEGKKLPGLRKIMK